MASARMPIGHGAVAWSGSKEAARSLPWQLSLMGITTAILLAFGRDFVATGCNTGVSHPAPAGRKLRLVACGNSPPGLRPCAGATTVTWNILVRGCGHKTKFLFSSPIDSGLTADNRHQLFPLGSCALDWIPSCCSTHPFCICGVRFTRSIPVLYHWSGVVYRLSGKSFSQRPAAGVWGGLGGAGGASKSGPGLCRGYSAMGWCRALVMSFQFGNQLRIIPTQRPTPDHAQL